MPGRDQPGLAVVDDGGRAGPVTGHDRKARGACLQQGHGEGLLVGGPDRDVAGRVEGGERILRPRAGEDCPLRPERRQSFLHQRAGLALADREELPGRVGDQAESAAQDAPGGQCRAGRHRRDREQPRA